jgi:hypothetical protein
MKEWIMNTAKTSTQLAAIHGSSKFTTRHLTNRKVLVMSWLTLLVAVLSAMIFAGGTFGEPPKVQTKSQAIPLDKVWAYEMPGTLDIQELGKGEKRKYGATLRDEISMAAVERLLEARKRPPTRSGFAVSGTGLAALREAHSVFVKNATPRERFSLDDEITLVFFSETAGGNRPHLRKIRQRDNLIELYYRLEPYTEGNLWGAIALIPVGKLAAGRYHVTLHQLPTEKKFVEWGFKPLDAAWAQRFICKPFQFSVDDKEK